MIDESTQFKFIPYTKQTDITNVVVDMTGKLNENEKEILALGHNFTLLNNNINIKTLTVDIEKACITARMLESRRGSRLDKVDFSRLEYVQVETSWFQISKPSKSLFF